jgi:hypothetical protein
MVDSGGSGAVASSRIWLQHQYFVELLFHCLYINCSERFKFTTSHVLFNRSDNSCDNGRIQKFGLAPSSGFAIANQRTSDIARNRGDNGFLSTTVVPVGAENPGWSMFHPTFIREYEVDQNDIPSN